MSVPWVDVSVALGPFPDNHPPTLTLEGPVQAAPGETVTFTAHTSDIDGDALSYHWDLGGGMPGPNAPTVSHRWDAPGDYVIRCETTDLKGGTASRHMVVRVGNLNALRISGRVIDQAGRPLAGVRVHNGLAGTNSPRAEEYRWAITDSAGEYTLVGLQAGEYPMGAHLDGYVTRPLNFNRPLVLNAFTGVNVDFISEALPEVTVEAIADGSETSGGAAGFRIARTGNPQSPMRVYFRVSGSAMPTEDYLPWPLTDVQTNTIPTVLEPAVQVITMHYVDFEPGAGSTNIFFPVVADTTPEGDETIVLSLSYPVMRTVISETETNHFPIPGWEVALDNGQETWFQTRPGYHLGSRAEAAVRILDASPAGDPTVSIVALDAELSENGGDSASFLVTLAGRAPDDELVVPIGLSGTATPGEDYAASTYSVRFLPGETSVEWRVAALDDRFVEGDEEIVARIEPGAGYSIGVGSATVRLVDDDLPQVSIAALDPVLSESGGPGRISVQRSGDLEHALDVDYLLSGTATAGQDYAPAPGRVTIPAGQTSAQFEIIPIDDGLQEGDETIVIQLGDNPTYNLAAPAAATILLQDDEYPVVTVEALVAETTEGGEPGTFVVRRRGPITGPLTVHYRLGGSALHQADYAATGDQITIPAWSSQAVLEVIPLDDAIREDPETITIELLPSPEYSLGAPAWAAIELLDNGDSAVAVGFAMLQSEGPESMTEPHLAVRISANPDEGAEQAVTVAWEVLGGSAGNGVDYILEEGTITFPWVDPAGEDPLSNRVAIIPLQVIDDDLAEGDETLLVRLRIAATEIAPDDPETPPTLVTNGIMDVFTVHTYTIRDDDLAALSVAATAPSTVEGGAIPGRFTVSRTGPTNGPVSVLAHYSGRATPGNDYIELSPVITIPAGAASVDVLVQPVDDPVAEYREDVVLTLVHVNGARIVEPRSATVTIDDNDGVIEFAAARWTVSEDEPAARIMLRRTGDTNVTASAVFAARPGTASAPDDFEEVEETVTFMPGEVTREVQVAIVADDITEGPETVALTLARATDLFPMGGQNAATLIILDDDAYLSSGTNAPVGAEGEGILVVVVERTGPTAQPETLRFASRNGSALAGEDFEPVEGEIHFEAGASTASIPVLVIDDGVVEGDETFAVEFFRDDAPVGEIIATIVDDDCAIEMLAPGVTVDEDAGFAELLVVRHGSPLRPLRVAYRAFDGSAVAGSDFEAVDGLLEFRGNRFETLTNGAGETVFLPGDSNATIRVRILNDTDGERDETFEVRLTGIELEGGDPDVPYARFAAQTNAIVTIRDNESPGWVDEQFQPGLGADATVRALAIQRDGKLLVGGDFTTLDGVVLPRLGRLHADGFLDRSFNPGRGFDGTVRAVAELAGGRILAGGSFAGIDGLDRPNLALLEPDGTPVDSPLPAPDAAVHAIDVGPAVLVGGDFTRIGGHASPGVARLQADGSPDTAFTSGTHGRAGVRAVAALADGRVLVGGTFTSWGGSTARFLARLTADGAPDVTFRASNGPDGPVHAIARAPDGSLYIAGAFTSVSQLPRRGVARLLPDGGLDPSFDPAAGPDAPAFAIAALPASPVVLGGAFTSFADAPAGRFRILAAGGESDPSYAEGSGADDIVWAIAVQNDGAFILGGDFTEIDGRPRMRIARIHADEKFSEGFVEFAAGQFTADEGQGTVEIRARRTGAAKGETRVRYETGDGSASAGADYAAATGELVFPPGVLEQVFHVQVLDDALPEGPESVRLILTNATGALLGRLASAELLILDDEDAVAFETSVVEIGEADGTLSVSVYRSGVTNSPARVSYAIVAGSAQPGADYIAGGGVLEFAPGARRQSIRVDIVDDDAIEGPETFRIDLSMPEGGLALGSQSMVTVTIVDDDRLPTHHRLTVEPSPGGTVVPAGGEFPVGSVQTLHAISESGFEFARWEGTVTSVENPLLLTMDRDHVLVARFRPRDYLDTFESGDLSALPWETSGDAPWHVTDETASGGQFSARSGNIPPRGKSVLRLRHVTGSGGGSFDLRTSSERGWDFLEFRLNGELVDRWSGDLGWRTFQFNVPAGENVFEWIFSRDPTFGGGIDAVWIDNLDLPEPGAGPASPRITAWRNGHGCRVEVAGPAGRRHVLQVSTDMKTWRDLTSAISDGAPLVLEDPEASADGARFYRVRVE